MLPIQGHALPLDRIILLGDDTPRGDAFCYRRFRDQILGAEFLRCRLSRAAEICRLAGLDDLLAMPFILDIDLDSFNTRRAISPPNPSVFYDLIRAAYAITIALEPDCVSSCQLEGEDISASWLEQQLLAHIYKALS